METEEAQKPSSSTPFGKPTLGYMKKDKFKNFNGDEKTKVKMSDSFLAAKASVSSRHDVVYPEPEDEQMTHVSINHKNNSRDSEDFAVSEERSKTSLSDDEDDDQDTCDAESESDIQTSNGRFICKTESCLQTFATRKDLRRHKLSHRIRKHICPIDDCGRAFFEKSKLKRHMVVHTKKKEHSCHICGKKFGYKANVKTHMRTHTGERPFVCRVSGCGKSFAQASNRNAHEKTHYKASDDKKRVRLKRKKSSDEESTKKSKIETKIEEVEEEEETNIRRSTRLKTRDSVVDRTLTLNLDRMHLPQAESEGRTSLDTPRRFGSSGLLDFDEVVNDFCRSGPTSEQLPEFRGFVHDHHALGLHLQDDHALNNLFNSFTSFGNSSATGNFGENDLNSMFKNDFGLNLDHMGDHDVFGNLPFFSEQEQPHFQPPPTADSKKGNFETETDFTTGSSNINHK